jgi:signal peptidase I
MKKQTLSWLREMVETIVIAFVLAFLIKTFIVGSFWIPSGSMEPTLQINDRILAYKIFYGLKYVKHGHIIVFKYPLNPRKDFIKRVIGLPKDTVKVRNKKVYVNGELLNEPYVVHRDPWESGFPRDEYGPVQVPEDSLFVMGDNRDSSDDSRYWGFVPADNIVGRAVVIYWPPWRIRIMKRPIYWREKPSTEEGN